MLWLLLGCKDKDEVPPAWVALVDPAAWAPLAAEDDPFEDRPDDVTCLEEGYTAESGAFEVKTGLCGYGTFSQPILHDVAEGDPLKLVFWHLDLYADELTEAHIVIGVEDDIFYEDHIPIPSSSEILPIELDAPAAMKAGDPAYFHIHNHGTNSYSLGDIQGYTVP